MIFNKGVLWFHFNEMDYRKPLLKKDIGGRQ